jgi:hypothetical protein
MYSLGEIKKMNAVAEADAAAARATTFCRLSNGGVLIRHDNRAHVLEGTEATDYLKQVRGMTNTKLKAYTASLLA